MHNLLMEDIRDTALLEFPWERLQGKALVICGASGLIGSFLIHTIMYRNHNHGQNCKVYALGRNADKARKAFRQYWDSSLFQFVPHDMNQPLILDVPEKIAFVIHLASNTHPLAYANDPIGTISTNIFGTYHLLEFAAEKGAERFAFASSNEIYGENRGDGELFDEHYCGYIDCNTMRAGYPESKRCSEALCQAFRKQKNLDVVIPRFTRSYGPTMLMTDTKAISQFIRKGIAGEDIVLKSAGTQYYSYTYVADAVSGLLTVLFLGENGGAYNIADLGGDIMLKDLAAMIAQFRGKKVVFEIPDEVERSGYSTATKARLSGEKLKKLGWKMRYDIQSGIERTLTILSEEQ